MLTHLKPSTVSFRVISLTYVFVFAGAIIGETVALSMAVSTYGHEVIGRLYLFNGLLLFLLPALFFKKIDRINRGRLFSNLLLLCSVMLLAISVIVITGTYISSGTMWKVPMYVVYPLSYLSKTILLLTFWILANDIFGRGDAKKVFPKVAAWGFAGGMAGACIARLLLFVTGPEMLLPVWCAFYSMAFLLSRKIKKTFYLSLLKKEAVPDAKREHTGFSGLITDLKDVLSIKLVRMIGALYFFVFIGIFMLDYLFWRACHLWFKTSGDIASFQFGFYIVHGTVTMATLLLVIPWMISRWGFSRIISFFPVVLLVGSVVCLPLSAVLQLNSIIMFAVLIVFQFMRNVAFENSFSPVYQMFFASVSMEKRGRAKTMLEGMVKPSAIVISGIVLIMLEKYPAFIFAFMLVIACFMVWIAARLRTGYIKGLVPAVLPGNSVPDIISEIGSHDDVTIAALIKEYGCSREDDMRKAAIRMLAFSSSRQALAVIRDIYFREKIESVRETAAKSLGNFYWNETRELVELMLKDGNSRVRANAIASINQMNCNWKWRLKDKIKLLFFDQSVRVRIEAAQYLWKSGEPAEMNTVVAYMSSLTGSGSVYRRSAGLYLAGIIRPSGWEKLLIDNLGSSSFQVYEKCVEVIFEKASDNARMAALRIINRLSREHIASFGRIMTARQQTSTKLLAEFLFESERRMAFEVVHILRVKTDSCRENERERMLAPAAKEFLFNLTLSELKNAYIDGFVWFSCQESAGRGAAGGPLYVRVLDDAIRFRMLRICEWALDAVAVLDSRIGSQFRNREFDLNEYSDRMLMVEVLENSLVDKIPQLMCGILRGDNWEEIAAAGKQHFNLGQVEKEPGPGRFVHSENKWVSFTAMYYLYYSDKNRLQTQKIHNILELLLHDTDRFVSASAALLLGQTITHGEQKEENGMKVFELLEAVLFLKNVLLFRNVPAEKLMTLAEISKEVRYKRNSLVSCAGELAEHLYIVKTGSLKIVRENAEIRTILAVIRPGESYGETGLLNQLPRSVSAVANEDCQLFVIGRKTLKKLLLEMPEIACNFIEIFGEKLRKNAEEMALLQTATPHDLLL